MLIATYTPLARSARTPRFARLRRPARSARSLFDHVKNVKQIIRKYNKAKQNQAGKPWSYCTI